MRAKRRIVEEEITDVDVDHENEGTAFHEITQKISVEVEPIDLRSKVVKYRTERNHPREITNGTVVLFDLSDKILSKVMFKNLSPGGASFEVPPIKIRANDQVFMGFASAVNLGTVLCTVQWVRDIPGHKLGHKMIGLKFKKLTTLQRKELNKYLTHLQNCRENPVYVGG